MLCVRVCVCVCVCMCKTRFRNWWTKTSICRRLNNYLPFTYFFQDPVWSLNPVSKDKELRVYSCRGRRERGREERGVLSDHGRVRCTRPWTSAEKGLTGRHGQAMSGASPLWSAKHITRCIYHNKPVNAPLGRAAPATIFPKAAQPSSDGGFPRKHNLAGMASSPRQQNLAGRLP